MNQIFIAPNSGEQNSEVFKKTESGGYKYEDLFPLFSEQDAQHLKQYKELYFWGNKPSSKSKWKKMNNGDFVFFYSKRTINSYGKLIYKCHNPILAEKLWGWTRTESGSEVLWEYIFFFEKPKKSNVPFITLSKFAGYSDNFVVQGLLPYSEKGTDEIIKQFGGIENLFSNNLQRMNFDFNHLGNSFSNSGLLFEKRLLIRFLSSLLTKPFVILTGLSGSGKTKLAQAFVQWICQEESQYRIIPVGADWTNHEPLLGYPNGLNLDEYVTPDSGVLYLITEALKNENSNKPYFLILDEMNLSHVERYFADFLSIMESKDSIKLYSGGERKDSNGIIISQELIWPDNLFIIGTVNIDETTNMFSPKVLDRANTIEFRVTYDEMKGFLGNIKEIDLDSLKGKGAAMAKSFLEMASTKIFASEDIDTINSSLLQFFTELKKTGAEFGYRSATEIFRLIHQLSVLDNTLTTDHKLDIAIMQKLLPKLHGSRRKLCPVLETLGSFCVSGDTKIIKEVFEKQDYDFNGKNVLYPLSLEKISRMYRGAIDNGFASFAEA